MLIRAEVESFRSIDAAVELSMVAVDEDRDCVRPAPGADADADADILAPVRDVRHLPRPEKKISVLTPEQLPLVQHLIHDWWKGSGHGPRPNVATLENAMWIMVGTGIRVAETDMAQAPDRVAE